VKSVVVFSVSDAESPLCRSPGAARICGASVENLTLRQRRLELRHARVGDHGLFQVQLFQPGQALEVDQPGVGDMGADYQGSPEKCRSP
jgi:hypothetical protein